ncbi:hypothetical protein PVT71_16400 [Salipiger sp. H15]|uniref:Uncharacterized protein n=1 Tax=Alloyangia sp. H15 TaxID=3029062 RepID=A0AAU8APL2_9RHOB
MSPFQPSPVLLALIVLKSFVYFELLALLALGRTLFGRGPSRLAALVSLGLACLGSYAGLAPMLAPQYGLTGPPLLPALSRLLTWQQGLPALLLASAPLALSAALPSRRLRGIDMLHGLLIATLLALWLAARYS